MTRAMTMLAAAACVMLAGGAEARTLQFHAALSGQNQVPPVQTQGSGNATATLNTQTRVLHYDVTYQNLTGPATAAHIHGPATASQNAPVMIPFGPDVSSPIKGEVTLTPAQMHLVETGMTYVNVHTKQNPGGEIRGQLTSGH